MTKRAAGAASAIFFKLARSQAWVLKLDGRYNQGDEQLIGAIAGQRVKPNGFGGVKRQPESRAFSQVFPQAEAQFHLAIRNPASILPAIPPRQKSMKGGRALYAEFIKGIDMIA